MKKCRQIFWGRYNQKKDLHFIQNQPKVESLIHSTNRWMLKMKLRCLHPAIAVIMAIGIISILSACGTIMDTSDRITGEKDTDDENQSDASMQLSVLVNFLALNGDDDGASGTFSWRTDTVINACDLKIFP